MSKYDFLFGKTLSQFRFVCLSKQKILISFTSVKPLTCPLNSLSSLAFLQIYKRNDLWKEHYDPLSAIIL